MVWVRLFNTTFILFYLTRTIVYIALHIEHAGFTCILTLYKVYTHTHTHIYIYIYICTFFPLSSIMITNRLTAIVYLLKLEIGIRHLSA